MPLNLDYFYGSESEQFSFYRIPKILFTHQHYKAVSLEAKILYGLLLDRMGLSSKNDWRDDDGRVFIYFAQEDVQDCLCCGRNKVIALFKELEETGLIERKKQGQGKPATMSRNLFSVFGRHPVCARKKPPRIAGSRLPRRRSVTPNWMGW